MKIKYEFATETISVDVDDEWANILIDLDRVEYNNDHAETRRHCSLDEYDADGNLVASGVNIENANACMQPSKRSNLVKGSLLKAITLSTWVWRISQGTRASHFRQSARQFTGQKKD